MLRVEQILHIIIVNRAQRNEILLSLMLYHCRQEVINLTRLTEEHLALTVLNELLNVERNSLNGAEILHILRNGNTHFLSEIEVIIYSVARSEHHGSVIK